MLRRVVAVAFALGLMVVSSEAQTAADTSALIPLLKVLRKYNVSASLELTTCSRGAPEFPSAREPIATETSVLQAVHSICADHPDIEVVAGGDRIIRIVQRGTPTDLLNIQISQIPFTIGWPPNPRPIYSANAAAVQVFGAPEVQRFVDAHDITIPGGVRLCCGIISRDGSIPVMPSTTPHVRERCTTSPSRKRSITYSRAFLVAGCTRIAPQRTKLLGASQSRFTV